MKQVVVKLCNLEGDKAWQRPKGAVTTLLGIKKVSINTKDKKLTVVGDVDPVDVVSKLKKWHAKLVTVGKES